MTEEEDLNGNDIRRTDELQQSDQCICAAHNQATIHHYEGIGMMRLVGALGRANFSARHSSIT